MKCLLKPQANASEADAALRKGNLFLLLAAILLVVTALLKVLVFTNPPSGAIRADPVFCLLTTREVTLVAALAELAIAWQLLSQGRFLSRVSILWSFCICALLYHLGVFLLGSNAGCPCLGTAQSLLEAVRKIGFELFANYKTTENLRNSGHNTRSLLDVYQFSDSF